MPRACIEPELSTLYFDHHKLVTRYQTIQSKQHEYQSKPGSGTQAQRQ